MRLGRIEQPTVDQMQDARVGSIVVEKDWQSGEVSLSLGLEKTEDGVTWTAYEGGTWTETAGGKFTLSFPLTETKNWPKATPGRPGNTSRRGRLFTSGCRRSGFRGNAVSQ